MKTVKVFVYGTLKKGFRLNPYMGTSEFITQDTLKGFDIYSNGSYPMIVKGTDTVIGEVYNVPISLLPTLDLIESEYTRTKVNTGKHKGVFAYVYKYETDHLEKLDGEFTQKY